MIELAGQVDQVLFEDKVLAQIPSL